MKKTDVAEQHLPEIETAQAFAKRFFGWTEANIFTWDSLQQIGIIVLIVTLTWLVTRKISAIAAKQTPDEGKISWFVKRTRLSFHEILFLLLFPFFLWLSVPLAEMAKAQTSLLLVAANLLSAWSLIRISSTVIKSGFWSKTIAWMLWTIAALNILNWLGPTLDFLDKTSFSIGSFKLSLFVVTKGIVAFITFLWLAAALSGWLERALWNSDGLSPSQKVLFHKTARVVLIVVAIFLSLGILGIDLTAFAVFSGALGIGVGLGLQKVFSNLVSGFILLMDKSIKPGDVIAIGDTYGWVNRLAARYVSILTRDGKEHLIPNENLIVEPVENWSYSSSSIRIHIPVGVSYTSDIATVKKILLEVAASNPRILKAPQPVALIMGLGESAINFELRAWIADPVNGVSNITSALYEGIIIAFREQRIEIPFPQRVMHIKNS